MEAMNNAVRHGYDGQNGPVLVRWRHEAAGFRVEIADEGRGGVSPATVKASSGGFASMRPHFNHIDARERRGGGIILTLFTRKEVSR